MDNMQKELVLKDIHVNTIEDDYSLWGGLSATFDNKNYHVEFCFDMEYGAEIAIVYLNDSKPSEDGYCGSEIPVEPYTRIIDAYITDYINDFFTHSSNEVHIFIDEDEAKTDGKPLIL